MKLFGLDLEVRAAEVKTSTKTGNQYILLRVEDEHGSWGNLIDRNMDHAPYYTKGVFADFTLEYIHTQTYASLSVIDVTLKNDH